MRTLITIHALAEYNGKYLVLKRSDHRSNPGYWNCVTGHVKENETAEEAAIRELKEETNLDGDIVKTADPLIHNTKDQRWIILAYMIKVSDITQIKIDENESQDHRWIELNDELVNKYVGLKETLRILGLL
jgi:ADP-ribose pyrophosphatase YjhB (NUDIX family)